MLKYSIGLLLALIIALGISVKTLESRSTDLAESNQKLETAQEELEKQRQHEAKLAGKYEAQYLILTKTIKARDERIKELSQEALEVETQLNEALEQNRQWSDSSVPIGVRSGLCGYVNCTQ